MKNYKITLQYDGTRYLGWEHQPGKDNTIQGKVETLLARMLDLSGDKVPKVIGAGRTDAGVHADAMVCNVHMETSMTPEEIRDYMNTYLPDDIGVTDVREASERFHARYNAVGKTYRYTCWYGATKPVFDRRYVYVLDVQPDLDAMRKAAGYLLGTHDFKSFCGNPKMKKSTVRRVDSIEIEQKGERIIFTYHGSGFLQYMVRILTGTLLEVGFGKRPADSIPKLIAAEDRTLAGYTVPAKGLCMMKVDY